MVLLVVKVVKDFLREVYENNLDNKSDELGTGNTRHFRKSIVNDESDEC
jgi:hypothetical protein